MTPSQKDVTELLGELSKGKREALDALMPLVYEELRSQARSFLSHERPDHTLQATALVHEAYMRLVEQRNPDWQNRAQFYGLAAQEMRRILMKHAERHHAQKRGGHAQKLPLDDNIQQFEEQTGSLFLINQALDKLTRLDPRQAQIVELRFFGGRTNEEIAEALDISLATVKREWRSAKAFLRGELAKQ